MRGQHVADLEMMFTMIEELERFMRELLMTTVHRGQIRLSSAM